MQATVIRSVLIGAALLFGYGSADKRANDIAVFLAVRGLTRGQFLITTVDRAEADPMGKVFLKPGSGDYHSLRDL